MDFLNNVTCLHSEEGNLTSLIIFNLPITPLVMTTVLTHIIYRVRNLSSIVCVAATTLV